MKRLQWDDYTGTWVNPNNECGCHQMSGDSPSCRYHYASTNYALARPGVPYAAPVAAPRLAGLRVIRGGKS